MVEVSGVISIKLPAFLSKSKRPWFIDKRDWWCATRRRRRKYIKSYNKASHRLFCDMRVAEQQIRTLTMTP